MKIYDLIYFDRQNEGAAVPAGKLRRWMFGVSILLGVAGTALLMAGDLITGIIGAGGLLAALFGFFLSFASGVPAFFEKRPARGNIRGRPCWFSARSPRSLPPWGLLWQ